MERKKWFILPFSLNMLALIITQIVIPANPMFIEANPFVRFIYETFGHFYFMPIYSIFMFFFIMPRLLDWVISKTNNGEQYRKIFEWLFIGMAIVWTSADFFNNLIVFVNVYPFVFM